MFIPAVHSGIFAPFLLSLFVLAAGLTIIQVSANPLISSLGDSRTAHSRLTFGQAFNSLGTAVFPLVGALFILDAGTSDRTTKVEVVAHAYLAIAALLLVCAAAIWWKRNALAVVTIEKSSPLAAFSLLKRRRFAACMLAIFLYVGAEVAIGSLLVAYLVQGDTLGLSERTAGAYVAIYWSGALVGGFAGSFLLRVIAPPRMLMGVAIGAAVLLSLASLATGGVSGWALLAIGLMNSIMFPTIFSLALEGLGPRTADGSGPICMAIVGSAIVPPLTGMLTDDAGLRLALALPGSCYVLIAAFGQCFAHIASSCLTKGNATMRINRVQLPSA